MQLYFMIHCSIAKFTEQGKTKEDYFNFKKQIELARNAIAESKSYLNENLKNEWEIEIDSKLDFELERFQFED